MENLFSLLAFGDAGWGDEILRGALMTVELALATLPVGLLIGFGVATASLSRWRGVRWLGFGYSTVMRGLPELLTLFIIYFGVGALINAAIRWLHPEAEAFSLSPFIAGATALGMVFGAFAGEVLRGAFQALDKGQTEAARAVGMTEGTIFRRIKLPQIWRFALPGIGNLWVNLLKDTSLVSALALSELMRATQLAFRSTKEPFFFLFVACALYWAACVASEIAIAAMERRANRGVVRAGS